MRRDDDVAEDLNDDAPADARLGVTTDVEDDDGDGSPFEPEPEPGDFLPPDDDADFDDVLWDEADDTPEDLDEIDLLQSLGIDLGDPESGDWHSINFDAPVVPAEDDPEAEIAA